MVVCRKMLTFVDISKVVNAASGLVNDICASFDGDEANLCCKEHQAIDRDVEMLTEYLRLLRNACAHCLCHQSVMQK